MTGKLYAKESRHIGVKSPTPYCPEILGVYEILGVKSLLIANKYILPLYVSPAENRI